LLEFSFRTRRTKTENLSPSFFLFFLFLLLPSATDPTWLLFDAAQDGNAADVKHVLEENPGLDINWKNPDFFHRTFLHSAAERGHLEIVKILLAHPQINVNTFDGNGLTALAISCDERNTEVGLGKKGPLMMARILFVIIFR